MVATSFDDDERVHVPRVFWDYTRDDVITEERIRGIKIDDMRALDAAGLDRPSVARLFADAYLSMVFVRGFFHADPHPGNIFVESAQRIGLVDFGMVGRVEPHTRRGLGTILLALVANDASRMADGLLALESRPNSRPASSSRTSQDSSHITSALRWNSYASGRSSPI